MKRSLSCDKKWSLNVALSVEHLTGIWNNLVTAFGCFICSNETNPLIFASNAVEKIMSYSSALFFRNFKSFRSTSESLSQWRLVFFFCWFFVGIYFAGGSCEPIRIESVTVVLMSPPHATIFMGHYSFLRPGDAGVMAVHPGPSLW